VKRKRDLEGYVEVDHSNSPGITAEQAASVRSRLVVPGGTVFKSATITCSHCKAVVILNPNRSRGRGYCRSCDHSICDRCSLMMKLGHPCRPFDKIAEEIASKGKVTWLAG
jgi:hypothetical protein